MAKPLLDEFLLEEPCWKVYTHNELTVKGVPIFGWRKLKSLFDVRLHHHPRRFEFHLFQGGTYTFEVEGKSHTVNGGMVFITLPNELHKGHFAIPGGHEFYWFQLQIDQDTLGLPPQKAKELLSRLTDIRHRAIPFTAAMEQAIQRAFPHARSSDPFWQHYAETALADFLYQLVAQDQIMDTTVVSPEIQQAIDFMKQSLHRRTDLPTVAKRVGLSDSFFRAKFKKEMGISPLEYYTGLRIEEAKRLLAEGCSVTRVAEELDFATPNYFATVFRKATQQTPSQYQATILCNQEEISG